MEGNAMAATEPIVNYPPGTDTPHRVPVTDYLVLDEQPYLRAQRCDSCGALYFDRRNACARCFATEFSPSRLSDTGRISAYTVVHRAAPHVPTPYMSVVVTLDGGGTVKATLLGVTDTQRITPGLRVKLATFVAGTDDDAKQAIAFGYEIDEDTV